MGVAPRTANGPTTLKKETRDDQRTEEGREPVPVIGRLDVGDPAPGEPKRLCKRETEEGVVIPIPFSACARYTRMKVRFIGTCSRFYQ